MDYYIHGPSSSVCNTVRHVHQGTSRYSSISFQYADYEGCRITCQGLAQDKLRNMKYENPIIYECDLIYTETMYERDEILLLTFVTEKGLDFLNKVKFGYYVNIDTNELAIEETLAHYKLCVDRGLISEKVYSYLKTLASIDDRFCNLFEQMRSNRMFIKMSS